MLTFTVNFHTLFIDKFKTNSIYKEELAIVSKSNLLIFHMQHLFNNFNFYRDVFRKVYPFFLLHYEERLSP